LDQFLRALRGAAKDVGAPFSLAPQKSGELKLSFEVKEVDHALAFAFSFSKIFSVTVSQLSL
jgi:hypothetical protein